MAATRLHRARFRFPCLVSHERPTETDDEAFRKHIAETLAGGLFFTEDELLQLIRGRSLDDLALLNAAYQLKTASFLRDPNLGVAHGLALGSALNRHLSEAESAMFHRSFQAVCKGIMRADRRVTSRLPKVNVVQQENGVAIKITFPDEQLT